ncbi:hypothetical protein OIE69_43960 (plasmid) [Actinacidiphila glaucinigra]|nr:hypothetical protein [Actinacidiphila glaucinigra]WSD65861.1 hypothetical protein OIE69_43960 [Actinacidiphila glaucinigra]
MPTASQRRMPRSRRHTTATLAKTLPGHRSAQPIFECEESV